MFMLPCVGLVNLYYIKEFYGLGRINLSFLTICLSVGTYSLLASGSRGPMVGFLFLFVGIVGYLLYRKAYEALFAHCSGLVCAMFVNFYAGHCGLWTKRVLNLMTDTSVDTRLIAWDTLLSNVLDVPFWGVGPGVTNTSFFIQKYLPAPQVILTSYNIFIEYYLCLGFVGLGLFCALLIMLFRNTLVQWTQHEPSYQICFSACVLSMIIAGMFESFIHHVQAQIMFSLFMALALTAGRSTTSAKIKPL
jgi:O-antigen ligase